MLQYFDILKEQYDQDKFQKFSLELLNSASLSVKKLEIDQHFTPHIESLTYLGLYEDSQGKKLHILDVNLKTQTKLEQARTMQRNLIAKYLKDHWLDSALVAFHTDATDSWRLSFVKVEYRFDEQGKTKEEITPAKRYSFLVGEGEPTHTAQTQLNKIYQQTTTNPTLAQLEEAFGIEKVTKEFFEKYRELFESVLAELKTNHTFQNEAVKNNIDTANFAKKLLGQIVFLYFLQKKGWLGVPRGKSWGEGDRLFLSNLFRQAQSKGENFFNNYLEVLFYDTLNNPRRNEVDPSYSKHFDSKVPFLNGGLFEPQYDWQNSMMYLDNKVFEKVLGVFDRYNFTVKEDEPLEKEVAVDPEMLGKVFENLLEENLRKGKGTYYTPREIVHYMCQESLINYLIIETKSSDKDIRDLIEKSFLDQDQMPKVFDVDWLESVDQALKGIKVVDPACGSGAFLVGMLQEIVRLRYFIQWYFLENKAEIKSEYPLKKESIQNNIHGVDIDPGAIEIAKLRLWLSLVVDYDLEQIEPLPNLDYKIMQGNSLLEELVLGDTSVKLFDAHSIKNATKTKKMRNLFDEETRLSLFDDLQESKTILKDLKRLQYEYFSQSDSEAKKRIKAQIDRIEQELIEASIKEELGHLANQKLNIRALPGIGFMPADVKRLGKISSKESQILAILDELKKTGTKPFFLWHLYFSDVFEEKGGFNIVIANPPYIDSESMVKDGQKDVREAILKTYEFTKGNWDIYIAFFELAFRAINDNGVLTFITPDKWISKPFGDELRKRTINNIFSIVKAGRKVFDSAKVDSIISFFSKKNSKNIKIIDFQGDAFILKREINKQLLKEPYALDFLFSDYLDLLIKIESASRKLSDLGNCENACATSDAYKLAPLVKNTTQDFDRKNQLKIINTGTIGKYFSKWGYQEMTYLGHKYLNPIIERKDFFDLFKNSYSTKSIQPKLIIKGLNLLDSCLDIEGEIIPGKSTLIITSKNVNELKTILSIINSKLAFFYIRERYPASSYNQGTTFTKGMINSLPIPEISKTVLEQILNKINDILTITENDGYFQNDSEKTRVKLCGEQIDRMVYKLYGLTDEEIQIIETKI